MIETVDHAGSAESAEAALREQLAQGDAAAGTIVPILQHLLASRDHGVFGDEIIARVRAMLHHLASQMLDARAAAGGAADPVDRDSQLVAGLAEQLVGQDDLLRHCHAAALEWQLTERLQARLAIDPVLSPLLQSQVASTDAATAGVAMALLAAQARFVQQQRRMELPLTELPGDVLHAALAVFRAYSPAEDAADLQTAERVIRANHDESRSRLGLIARMVAEMGGGADAALSLGHAGTAIFLTALAMGSGQARDSLIPMMHDGQLTRFALLLHAAGLKQPAVEEAVYALNPQAVLPAGLANLGADRAAALLAASAPYPGG